MSLVKTLTRLSIITRKNETVKDKLKDEKEADIFSNVAVRLKHLSVDVSKQENEEVSIFKWVNMFKNIFSNHQLLDIKTNLGGK